MKIFFPILLPSVFSLTCWHTGDPSRWCEKNQKRLHFNLWFRLFSAPVTTTNISSEIEVSQKSCEPTEVKNIARAEYSWYSKQLWAIRSELHCRQNVFDLPWKTISILTDSWHLSGWDVLWYTKINKIGVHLSGFVKRLWFFWLKFFDHFRWRVFVNGTQWQFLLRPASKFSTGRLENHNCK